MTSRDTTNGQAENDQQTDAEPSATDDANSSESDPFAVLRALDEEVITEESEQDDDWGAKVRVCVALARGERPTQEDCEAIGLPYTEPAAFEDILTSPGPASESPAEPTREQARPLARQVVTQLRERTEE